MEFFFDKREQVKNLKVMILEGQFQNFSARMLRAPSHTRQSFHFKKIPEGPNINIFFVKIGMKLSFT